MSAGSLLRLAAIAHICLLRSPELIAFYVPGRPALPTKERVPILNSVAASLAPVWRPAMRIIAQALWLSGCVEQGTDHRQILRSAGLSGIARLRHGVMEQKHYVAIPLLWMIRHILIHNGDNL